MPPTPNRTAARVLTKSCTRADTRFLVTWDPKSKNTAIKDQGSNPTVSVETSINCQKPSSLKGLTLPVWLLAFWPWRPVPLEFSLLISLLMKRPGKHQLSVAKNASSSLFTSSARSCCSQCPAPSYLTHLRKSGSAACIPAIASTVLPATMSCSPYR